MAVRCNDAARALRTVHTAFSGTTMQIHSSTASRRFNPYRTTTAATPRPTVSNSVALAATPDVTRQFRAQFGELARNPARFAEVMKTAFGGTADTVKLESLRQRALAGDFSWMPKVRWASAAEIGTAYGAYDAKADVVYLNDSLRGNPKLASQVFVEEAGHALDARVNRTDTVGDEGELFRRILSGESLSASQIAAIRAENDHGTMRVNGREIAVENLNVFKAIVNVARGVKKVASGALNAGKKVASGVFNATKKAVKGAIGVSTRALDATRKVARGVVKRIPAAASFVFKNLNPVQLGKTLWTTGKNIARDGLPTLVNFGVRLYSASVSMARDVGSAFSALRKGDFKGFGKSLLNVPKTLVVQAYRAATEVSSLVPALREVMQPGSTPKVERRDIELAEIANAVGASREVPGFQRITVAGIDGMTASGFQARTYLSEDGKRLVLAFGGTNGSDIHDILNNLGQAFGEVPPQYRMAVEAAELAMAEAKRRGATLEVTGHSLGGGLAQTAALAVGAKAVTFNAAGLASGVRSMLGSNVAKHQGLITNYVVRGEILDSADINNRVGKSVYLEPARAGFWSEVKNSWKASATRHQMGEVLKALHAGLR